MESDRYRVLVVEDEAMIRQLTMRALAKEGFACDSAIDGDEAIKMVESHKYDLVVTDLCMPNTHGHALGVRILQMEDRPSIVVLTGVTEPRLAKDLISRGVDDVMFKPIPYATFAAKVKALVNRRRANKHSDSAV